MHFGSQLDLGQDGEVARPRPTKMAAVSRTVTVVTYNVLAPMLCSADRFITSDPRNLDPSIRWKKVVHLQTIA